MRLDGRRAPHPSQKRDEWGTPADAPHPSQKRDEWGTRAIAPHPSQERDEWGTPADAPHPSQKRDEWGTRADAPHPSQKRDEWGTRADAPHPSQKRDEWGTRAVGLLLGLGIALLSVACAPPRSGHVVIGAKDFTEQVVLGELLAQEIEASGGGPVERRFWLAGSYLCQQALVSGRIDGYVEYTGTALTAILKQPLPTPGTCDEACVHAKVAQLYARRFGVVEGPGLGFEDTFAMVVRGDEARRLGWKTISDLGPYAAKMRLGVGYEFAERPDGLRGLSKAYGLRFAGAPRTMELGLLYRALAAKQVDIVAGNSTDGAIQALGFVALQDDRHYFPPYEAVPLVREDALRRWPQIGVAMQRLAGKVSEREMRAMNFAVESQHKDVAEVVRQFRASKGL